VVPLNILCQSPVSEGMTQQQAVHNTVDLAKLADGLGYRRFWVAEHHSDAALASGAPEVMVSHIASVTQNLRVGSGGVLLPFYSPLKVAEQFNLLQALFPGRIDLGIGRSGGSEGHAPQALGHRGASFKAVDELLSWLGRGQPNRPYADTHASPQVDGHAMPWVLGTSPGSATYAGQRGLPYAFGGFLDPRGLVPALAAYHQHFQPSRWCERPYVNLAWYVQAADTEREAKELARSSEHWFIETMLRGGNPPFPGPDTTRSAQYSAMEEMALAMRRQFALIGTADQVRSGLQKLVETYRVDELTLVTIPFEHEARRASYELVAKA
jgi:luciferase family oxidoreductase group 1